MSADATRPPPRSTSFLYWLKTTWHSTWVRTIDLLERAGSKLDDVSLSMPLSFCQDGTRTNQKSLYGVRIVLTCRPHFIALLAYKAARRLDLPEWVVSHGLLSWARAVCRNSGHRAVLVELVGEARNQFRLGARDVHENGVRVALQHWLLFRRAARQRQSTLIAAVVDRF